MAASLLMELLNSDGNVISLPSLEVSDNISLEEATELMKNLLNTTDTVGLKDTMILLNAYLVIELGPKQAKLAWDKLFDKQLNDVTTLLRK